MLQYNRVIKMHVATYKNIEVSHTTIQNKRTLTKIHYHDDYELYYLVAGKTNYFIGDEIFRVNPGNFVFVGKGVIHKTDSEDCHDNERILLSFNDDILTADAYEHIETLSKQKLIFIPQSKLYIFEDILHKIEKEYSEDSLYRREMINLYILQILALLCRMRQDITQSMNETEKIIHSISEYINSNFEKDLSLKTLSRRFAMSEGHLSRKFKAVSGMGLCEYITYVRIHNGARLLAETNFPLTKISAMCGFNDSNYFSSVFKRIKGTTPCKYQKGFSHE